MTTQEYSDSVQDKKREGLEYLEPITLQEAIEADEALFHRLVNADMRNLCHPSVSAALRSPELIDRWIYQLNSIKRRIESQLARHKTSIQAMLGDQRAIDDFVRSQAKWKTGAISMRAGAEGRLAEARLLANEHRTQLLGMIREHREHVLNNPEDSGDADKQLWQVLDQ